jgi:transaldolase
VLLYLDTANVAHIRNAAEWGAIHGVTTNTTLVAREGRDFHDVVKEIAGIVDGPVSAEVISTETDGMIEEARELNQLAPSVVIKIPMTRQGMAAVKQLSQEGISINVTLVFSAVQAMLAARAGATYVSPFIGRLDDIGHNGIQLVEEIVGLLDTYDLDTQVIAASIRHPRHVLKSAQAGVDIATVPYDVLTKLYEHPLTDVGLERFLADWESLLSE